MSADRHRALPTWMSATAGEKKKEPLKSRRKPKVSRSVFYCLNEKELVEAAVSVLTHAAAQQDVELRTDRKVPDKTEDVATATREKWTALKTTTTKSEDDEWSDLSDARVLSYVSETDLDITEVETLPYTKTPQDQAVEGQRSGPVQDGLAGVDTDKGAEHPPAPSGVTEREDDGLQLVREIFFS